MARLSHPHVVTVIDFGEDDGTPYIVLEYVEGETLKERIRRMGRLPVAEAVAYAIEIGRALSAAHAERLVHRDVKPQNVLIDVEGRAKVTDFGIARSLEAHGLTATGRVLGTTDYVSPEQALGQRRDRAVRRLLARRRAVRDAHRRGPVQGGQPGGGGDEARARSRCPTCSGCVRRCPPRWRPWSSAPRPRRPRTATRPLRTWSTTSRRCWRSRCARRRDLGRGDDGAARAAGRHRGLRARCACATRAAGSSALSRCSLVVGGAVGYFATRTEKGAGGAATPQAGGPAPRRARQRAPRATTTPRATTASIRTTTQNAIDGNPRPSGDTERYRSGFEGAGGDKTGVGLYVDAGSPGRRKAPRHRRPRRPSFTAAVYGADGDEVPGELSGWEPLTASQKVDQDQQFDLRDGRRRFRYYLRVDQRRAAGRGRREDPELALRT